MSNEMQINEGKQDSGKSTAEILLGYAIRGAGLYMFVRALACLPTLFMDLYIFYVRATGGVSPAFDTHKPEATLYAAASAGAINESLQFILWCVAGSYLLWKGQWVYGLLKLPFNGASTHSGS